MEALHAAGLKAELREGEAAGAQRGLPVPLAPLAAQQAAAGVSPEATRETGCHGLECHGLVPMAGDGMIDGKLKYLGRTAANSTPAAAALRGRQLEQARVNEGRLRLPLAAALHGDFAAGLAAVPELKVEPPDRDRSPGPRAAAKLGRAQHPLATAVLGRGRCCHSRLPIGNSHITTVTRRTELVSQGAMMISYQLAK